MKKICVYGKGGIGKSTIVANIAAALSEMNHKVAVIGCDPKADSTRNLMGKRIPTLLDQCINKNSSGGYVHYGYNGILCIEAGGPPPGTGCSGRGIVVALERIKSENLLNNIDVVIYDVLGDVVCGGFSAPLREGIADEVYLVTTSDYMSIYAANNICCGIEKYASDDGLGLSGIIYNGRSSLYNPNIVKKFAEKVNSHVIGEIPMSDYISKAEIQSKTVIEKYPYEDISFKIKELAKKIYANKRKDMPSHLSYEEVEELCRKNLME